ncbi:MAG: Redoxin domain protein [Deltaproteobacteria bacterium]|nr:Redoxin domain protein [Deltaproteobacteria bacterium]
MPRLALILCVLTTAAACSKSIGDGEVVDYLRAKSPESRAQLLQQVTEPASAAQATGPIERAGAIHRGGAPLTLVGKTLDVGDPMPAVELADPKLGKIDLGALRGKLVVLSVVPSIDTHVCEAQTHKISDAITQMPPGTTVITVSRDLPYAQGRFAQEAMTQTQMGSDYHGGAFGRAFGLEVKETGLLARSVWVIGRDGKIAYRELVEDQGTEPNYDALIAASKRGAGT